MASIVVLGTQPSVTRSVVLSLYDPESSTVHLSEFELVFSPAARLPLGLCGVCDCIPHRTGQLPRFPVLRYCSEPNTARRQLERRFAPRGGILGTLSLDLHGTQVRQFFSEYRFGLLSWREIRELLQNIFPPSPSTRKDE